MISRKIKQFFDDLLFDFMEAVLKNNRLENALGLRELIRRGDVVFESGVFRFEHRISNNVAKEIEALGGKFSRALKGYKIDIKKIPPVLQQAIAEVKINNADKVKKIQAYLDNLQDTKQFALDRLKFDDEVIKIGADLDRQFKEVTKPVLEIAPKMTEFQKSEIAKNYTNNLEYYIRKWTDQEIVKLREDIQPLVMAGYRTDSLEKIISRHKGVSERKAKFLARQETRLLVAEYTKNRMKQAGISRFRWHTVLDGRERPEHKALNGQIFAFDELPIIDARTGEKGMPGQAFNCRCWAEAVIDWTLLNNDKTDVNGCLHGDDGKFKSKTAHKSVVNLSKEEYNHVVHELNNNLTKKEFKWKRTTRYIGNYGYDVIINDFNDYKIVDKWSIENADN